MRAERFTHLPCHPQNAAPLSYPRSIHCSIRHRPRQCEPQSSPASCRRRRRHHRIILFQDPVRPCCHLLKTFSHPKQFYFFICPSFICSTLFAKIDNIIAQQRMARMCPERRAKNEKIERAMDNIRGRFGKGAISSGATVKNNLGIGRDDAGDDKS